MKMYCSVHTRRHVQYVMELAAHNAICLGFNDGMHKITVNPSIHYKSNRSKFMHMADERMCQLQIAKKWYEWYKAGLRHGKSALERKNNRLVVNLRPNAENATYTCVKGWDWAAKEKTPRITWDDRLAKWIIKKILHILS